MVTNNGINKVSLNGKAAAVETFEYTNALLKDDVNDLYIDSAYAYFATNNGLIYFPVVKTKTASEAPKVFISQTTTSHFIIVPLIFKTRTLYTGTD